MDVQRTYKARDVEGLFDVCFYRHIGFWLARLFAKLNFTPSTVTVLGTIIGVFAGHFYYYQNLGVNFIGMALHVLANAMDNADGQLARMTKRGTREGRALDGFGDNLVFASVYLHLCLRYSTGGGSNLIWLLAAAAGASHSVQSSVADYLRNAYLHFVCGKSRAELDSSRALRPEFDQLRWSVQPWRKFLLRLYLNYTVQQETVAEPTKELSNAVNAEFSGEVPEWLRERYRLETQPTIKWFNLLATNTRMLILFALLFLQRPIWYFVVELTAFNLLLVFILVRQNRICRRLLPFVSASRKDTILHVEAVPKHIPPLMER